MAKGKAPVFQRINCRKNRIGNRDSGTAAHLLGVDVLKKALASGRPRDKRKINRELARRGAP